MTTFTHDTLPQRVVLDSGRCAARLAEELERLGVSRPMLIASEREQDLAKRAVGDLPVALAWDEVRQHVPVENAERARAAAQEAGVDVLVSVGGGSTTGLAKAVALTSGLPIVAVPTTYAGSEATRMWGLTEDRTKSTGIDDRVLPKVVIYDSTLTTGLPADLAVASGFNALAHCIDSMWAPGTDPIAQALALEGIRGLRAGLPAVLENPDDLEGRDACLYGAYLSAVSFATAGSGLHHKICHVLGGTFDLPHAPTHATVLPYVLAFNGPSAPEAAGRIAQALGANDITDPAAAADAALARLRVETNAPRDLESLGMPKDGIAEAVRRVLEVAPDSNPTGVTEANLTELLTAAFSGQDPADLTRT